MYMYMRPSVNVRLPDCACATSEHPKFLTVLRGPFKCVILIFYVGGVTQFRLGIAKGGYQITKIALMIQPPLVCVALLSCLRLQYSLLLAVQSASHSPHNGQHFTSYRLQRSFSAQTIVGWLQTAMRSPEYMGWRTTPYTPFTTSSPLLCCACLRDEMMYIHVCIYIVHYNYMHTPSVFIIVNSCVYTFPQ